MVKLHSGVRGLLALLGVVTFATAAQAQYITGPVGPGQTSSSSGGGVTCTGCSANDLTTYLSSGALGHITPGTGVATALAVNVGSSGAFVLNNSATAFQALATAAATASLTLGGPELITLTTANVTGLAISGGSITGSGTVVPGISVAGTLNTTGVVDGAVLFANITNTASGAGTLLADLQVGGASKFKISPAGTVTVAADTTGTFASASLVLSSGSVAISGSDNAIEFYGDVGSLLAQVKNNGYITIGPNAQGGMLSLLSDSSSNNDYNGLSFTHRNGVPGVGLVSPADNTIEQLNGATGQLLMVDNTWTNGTSWEAGVFDWRTVANTLLIGTERGSVGGSARAVELVTGGVAALTIDATQVATFAEPFKVASSTTGAGTQTFINSPCTGMTTEQWVPVGITGQTGTWYVPACQ